MLEKRINCYKCRYRGTIPGDAHLACRHAEAKKTGIKDIFSFRVSLAEGARQKLGIRGGGVMWPANFNPMFLTACNGFDPRESEAKEGSCQK